MNEKVKKMVRDMPLEIRLKVENEMLIQFYLVEIGHIPGGFWSDDKEKMYGKSFREFAEKVTKAQLSVFKQWEKDGRPK